MRAVVQRVAEARALVASEVVGEIGPGLCVLLGVARSDEPADSERLAGRVARLRIFENEEGKFDRSLVDTGGHNVLEPAVFGKAIVFGPYMQNFAEIAQAFVENDAAIQIRNARDLEHALLGLLNDPVRRARLGAAARALVEANRGARGKTMTAIARVLPPQDSGNVRPFRVVH